MKRPLRMDIALAAWMTACAILLGGCGGVLSSRHVTATSTINDPFPANAYYFLPLVKVRLIAERKGAAGEQKVSKEQESKAATSETTEGGKTTKKSTTSTTDTTKITTAGATSGAACTLAMKETLTEPDPRYMFSLSHLRDVFADDQVTISLAANGLLAKVETTSEGKAGEVVVKLAELAKESMKASAGLPAGVKTLGPGEGPFRYEVILDPTDAKAVGALNKDLEKQGCNLLVEVWQPEFPSAADPAQREAQRPKPASATSNPNDPSTAVRNGPE